MKKGKSKHWFLNAVLFLLLVAVISGFAIGFACQEQTLRQLEKERQEREVQKAETALQVEEMQRLIEYSGSDEYAVQQARRILDWVREDEILYVDPEEER